MGAAVMIGALGELSDPVFGGLAPRARPGSRGPGVTGKPRFVPLTRGPDGAQTHTYFGSGGRERA
jgi:hypothetical protein